MQMLLVHLLLVCRRYIRSLLLTSFCLCIANLRRLAHNQRMVLVLVRMQSLLLLLLQMIIHVLISDQMLLDRVAMTIVMMVMMMMLMS